MNERNNYINSLGNTPIMKCPICTDKDLVMADRAGVEIDYCPQCRGVWLDRGELDKIIERSNTVAIPQPGNQANQFEQSQRHSTAHTQHSHDDHHSRDSKHGYEHTDRKKSFIKDLFDF